MIKKTELIEWSKFGPRAMFGKFILNHAQKYKNLMVISADLGRSSGLDRFINEYPNNYLSVGIAEQNLIGIASGLAREGFKVFVTSFAPFLSMRASEQIRMNLGYMKHDVNVVALGSGLSMGFLGNSHFGLEDIAIMRTIPNLNIVCPADCFELKKTLDSIFQNSFGPTYIRLTGIPNSGLIYEKDYKYNFKKNVNILKGSDILVLSYGSILANVKKACEDLKNKNVSCELINVKIIKPLDVSIIKYLKKYKKIIIIEEHTKIGGLFSIVSELIVKNKIEKVEVLHLSLPDEFGPTGEYSFLLNFHKLSSKKIFSEISKFLKI